MSTVLNPIDLRDGGIGDLGTIDTIMQAAFDPRFGEAWSRSQCMGILALPGVWLTLATLGGAAAGFALARIVLDEAELLLLATDPGRRRRGVGAALLRSVEGEAAMRGARALHLEVRDGNDAIKLYRNAGFVKVGQRRNYYRGTGGRIFDAYTFNRDLC